MRPSTTAVALKAGAGFWTMATMAIYLGRSNRETDTSKREVLGGRDREALLDDSRDDGETRTRRPIFVTVLAFFVFVCPHLRNVTCVAYDATPAQAPMSGEARVNHRQPCSLPKAEHSKTRMWPDFAQFCTRWKASEQRHPVIFEPFGMPDPGESREDAWSIQNIVTWEVT